VEVSLFALADYALYSMDQKLSILGLFQTLYAAQFPAAHPVMYVVTQLRASPAEYGRNLELRIKLLDEDAKVLLDIHNRLDVPVPPNPGQITVVNNIAMLQAVQFPRPGRYEFSLLIDRDEKASLSLDVNQISAPASNGD
jgi:hypothetical protein